MPKKKVKTPIFERIKHEHIDALQEMGNIGSGHAASALAEILSRRINMSLPRFSLLSTPDLSTVKWRGKELDKPFATVIVETKGELRMDIIVVFDQETTQTIIDLISPSPNKIELNELTSFHKSVILEVGNILALNYLTAINNFIGISSSIPASPLLIVESTETILTSIATYLHPDFSYLLLVEVDIFTSDTTLSPLVILIPEEATVERSLRMLFGGK